jgi:hypothetical protein
MFRSDSKKIGSRRSGRIPPLGVVVLGLFIVLSSIVHIHKLIFDREVYLGILYGYLPPWLRELRYAFSWFQRTVGLVAGFGLFWGKNICRRLTIFIGWFTMIFVFWKHPYKAFQNHACYLDQQPAIRSLFEAIGTPDFTLISVVLPALIVYYLLEIAFWGSVVYYLTRPHVKAYFLSQ